MEDRHAEDSDEPADERSDDDTNRNAHATAANCGEDLARDDTGDGPVANH